MQVTMADVARISSVGLQLSGVVILRLMFVLALNLPVGAMQLPSLFLALAS